MLENLNGKSCLTNAALNKINEYRVYLVKKIIWCRFTEKAQKSNVFQFALAILGSVVYKRHDSNIVFIISSARTRGGWTGWGGSLTMTIQTPQHPCQPFFISQSPIQLPPIHFLLKAFSDRYWNEVWFFFLWKGIRGRF